MERKDEKIGATSPDSGVSPSASEPIQEGVVEKIMKRLKEGEYFEHIVEDMASEMDLFDLAELVRSGIISQEEAENALWILEESLCDFRAILTTGMAFGWDCLDCHEHGFKTCEIECSVPCEDCIRYNLCALLKPPYFQEKEEDEED